MARKSRRNPNLQKSRGRRSQPVTGKESGTAAAAARTIELESADLTPLLDSALTLFQRLKAFDLLESWDTIYSDHVNVIARAHLALMEVEKQLIVLGFRARHPFQETMHPDSERLDAVFAIIRVVCELRGGADGFGWATAAAGVWPISTGFTGHVRRLEAAIRVLTSTAP
jgi:hypothetical protein